MCCFLDHTDKCRQFDIATGIHKAHINFCSLTNDPGLENDSNDDGRCENPEEDPLSTISMTEELLTHIQPAREYHGFGHP